MYNNERVTQLIDIFQELIEVSGNLERTKIFPNLEVIDDAPTGLSSEYILIQDDEGFYIPALKVPGVTYAIGDKVNVLFIKGTEPIAFQHGSGSSGGGGSGGNVWPKPNKLMIGETEYPTLSAAISAAVSGNTIYAGVGTFACDNLTLPSGVNLVGGDRDATIFTTSTQDRTLTAAGSNYIANITITNTKVGVIFPPEALRIEGAFGLFNVLLDATDSSAQTLLLDSGATGHVEDSEVNGGNLGIYSFATGAVSIINMIVDTAGYGLLTDSSAGGTVTCIDTWFVNGQPDTGNLLGVRGWYFDSAGNIIFLAGTGISGEVWRTPQNGLRIKQGNFTGAIVASSDDDHIKLHAGNYVVTTSQEITTDLVIEGDGPEATIIAVNIDDNAAFNLNADNKTLVFKDLTILADGDGTYAGVFYVDNTGAKIILDNCIVRKNAGAPTNGYGAWLESGALELRNGSKLLSEAGTNQYGIMNLSSATGVIAGAGCEVGGATQDIYSTVASSTLDLQGPLLTNSLLSWAGTRGGHYLTASGDLVLVNASVIKARSSNFPSLGTTTLAEKLGHIYLGTSQDVFPFDDAYGLFSRMVNTGFTPLEHWKQGADELTWAGFAGYTGFSNPPNTVTRSASRIGISHTGGATRYFYYRTGFSSLTNKQIFALCTPRVNAQAGIMIDDGVNNADGLGANNFYRVFLDWMGGATTYAVLTVERRTGGGAITTTTYQNLIPSVFYLLGISATGTLFTNWSANTFYAKESPVSVLASTGGQTWTPARMGLYGRQNAAGMALQGLWDWWTEI